MHTDVRLPQVSQKEPTVKVISDIGEQLGIGTEAPQAESDIRRRTARSIPIR
ncbi:hypothetical protein BAU01nite_31110 [Brevibacterium aurantiacum]|nr:hypothetical protein BAU01nite_31110 [Brevibacterium aurantiacum]